MDLLSSHFAEYEARHPGRSYRVYEEWATPILLFISEVIARLTKPQMDKPDGIGGITVPETIAMDLFYAYYLAVENGYVDVVREFALEHAFTKILAQSLSEKEVFEVSLMKFLLPRVAAWNRITESIEEIEQICGFLCSGQNRSEIQRELDDAMALYRKDGIL